MENYEMPVIKKPPKLLACLTKESLENMRNRALFTINMLDAKGVRRKKLPLHECLILELKEAGYSESADYLEDLIYDNLQLMKEDEIGIVIELTKQDEFLEDIAARLMKAEKYRDRDEKQLEAIELLQLGVSYSQKGKGILWLAEKFFLAAMAVASQFLLDGGRQKSCSKYHYAKFLLDRFPGADTDEAFGILTEVRDASVGKKWQLYENIYENDIANLDQDADARDLSVLKASAIQLHRVLLDKVRRIRKQDPAKAERLSRLAERRAIDANVPEKIAEAIVEIGISQLMMNNLNNALNTFEKALKMQIQNDNVEGICETKMHMSAVLQKLGDHARAVQLLTEMGALAMEYKLRLQLGRALYLLGELYLRSERPELGTEHLFEAFQCFMGYGYQEQDPNKERVETGKDSKMGVVFKMEPGAQYIEEAEQARLMMAISAAIQPETIPYNNTVALILPITGQEYMSSYITLLRESQGCTVSQVKTIEWKLANIFWWVKKYHHNFIPCMCPAHLRSPLDVIRLLQTKKSSSLFSTFSITRNNDTIQDLLSRRSSQQPGYTGLEEEEDIAVKAEAAIKKKTEQDEADRNERLREARESLRQK